MAVVLVTGGTKGIGRSILEKYVGKGDEVFFTFSSNEQMAKKIELSYPKTRGFKLDLGSAECDKQLDAIDTALSGLDVLVNNAGTTKDGVMFMQAAEDWIDVMNINLVGAYKVTKKFLPKIIRGGDESAVVYISSVSAVIGVSGQTNYSASKAGMIGMARSLSKELGKRKVRVNCVLPGYIESDMTKKLDEKTRKKYLQNVPLRRFGTATEVAELVCFLTGPNSKYITGQSFVIDGGLT